MDFISVGPLEIVVILVIAFLLVGPEKLPDLAAKAGKLYRKFFHAAGELTKTINEDIIAESKAEQEKFETPADNNQKIKASENNKDSSNSN